MRCYHFGNFYLSQIQQGIQAAHAQMELFVKYQAPSNERDMLYEWATNHKTMVCLNGGNNASLLEIAGVLHNLPYPNVTFSEDEDSLGGILTNVAVVVSERIVDQAQIIREQGWIKEETLVDTTVYRYKSVQYDCDVSAEVPNSESQVIEIINSCRLI